MLSFCPFTKERYNYLLWGILFGFIFPLIATMVQALELNGNLSLTNLFHIQATTKLLWMIDTAPLFLGFFASCTGAQIDKLNTLNKKLEKDVFSVAEHLEKQLDKSEIMKDEILESRKRESKLIIEKTDALLANENTSTHDED